MTQASVATVGSAPVERQEVEAVVVRFAGDSGDGMQITGSQFTLATALAGNDLTTFPDFPAEIRAPIGTTFGVSSFQINFGSRTIKTAGDAPDVLVAMNPAALKVNLEDLKKGGMIIADATTFTARNLKKAGYAESNPLEDGSLDGYRLIDIEISKFTQEAVKETGLGKKDALRCKNFWTLGLVYWLYDRKRAPTIDWLQEKFAKIPAVADANVAALNAGHAFGETAELGFLPTYQVEVAEIKPGLYRTITGAEAMAYGLAAGTQLADLRMVFASYPITPASPLLHYLSGMKQFNILTFQAEDEIAAACAAIGASYTGSLGITSSSGPGVALKGEAIGLAVAVEVPMIIVNAQRAGPSTGLPTKTEQSDLFQAVYGRNADSPLVVISARSSTDCFEVAIEAVRLATKYMTPVIVLTDGYISNASEPWLIPDINAYDKFPVQFRTDPEGFLPYGRDPETLARPWVKPGTPDLMHRIGGIERADGSGNIAYEADNHQKMTDLRKAKIDGIAKNIPAQSVELGVVGGGMVVVGWGSTYGPINRAVGNLRDDGLDVSHVHIRHIWPMPENLGELLLGYDQVLVAEMNTGQLNKVLRAEFLVPAESLNKVNGQPFKIFEIEDAVRACLEAKS